MEDKKIKEPYFSKGELILWGSSVCLITLSFILFGGDGILTLCASLVGASSLIFLAKGNPIGQFLMIVFSVLYGIISYSFSYYGEMITYLGMSMPAAVFSLITWVRNPYNGNKNQVKIGEMNKTKSVFLVILASFVTVAFYFILKYFNTANLYVSTLSVTTSFIAAYFSFFRCPYFALAYAINDLVLIALWIYASFHSMGYISVVVCFVVFLVNDSYSFISWSRRRKQQKRTDNI
jgi:nicotinamide mononucleotide transporter PnuC